MRAGRSPGFVLVLVLAMLVVLSVLAGTIAATVARLRDQALERRQQLQAEIDMASTRATLFYLLSTQPMTMGGLTVDKRIANARDATQQVSGDYDFQALPIGNEVALDGRTYRGLGVARFSFQDDGGLYGVNHQPLWTLERLLAQSGQPPQLPAQVLFNRLMDYQDPDDLYRLNSLERDGYARMGLPSPSNLPLATPMELQRIPGWSEALRFMHASEINDTVTVAATGVLNINTAPARVLRTIPGLDANMAARAIARRELQPFLYESSFFALLGLQVNPENGVALYPSQSGTLKLWSSHGGRARLVHWTLTPYDNGGRPWREDYELNQSQNRPGNDVARKVAARLFAEPVAKAE